MTRLLVGIDPGRSGAIVALSPDREVVLALRGDGPEGYHRHAPKADPNEGAMLAALQQLTEFGRPAMVVIELPAWHAPGARMPAGVAGRSGIEHGIWRALCAAHGWPVWLMGAKAWRKQAGIAGASGGDPKAETIAHVGRRLPGLDLYPPGKRIAHDGLADAAGMALAALGLAK